MSIAGIEAALNDLAVTGGTSTRRAKALDAIRDAASSGLVNDRSILAEAFDASAAILAAPPSPSAVALRSAARECLVAVSVAFVTSHNLGSLVKRSTAAVLSGAGNGGNGTAALLQAVADALRKARSIGGDVTSALELHCPAISGLAVSALELTGIGFDAVRGSSAILAFVGVHTPPPTFRNAVDLLLGWITYPDLPDAAFGDAVTALKSFGETLWSSEGDFAAAVAHGLATELAQVKGGEPTTVQRRQLIALGAVVSVAGSAVAKSLGEESFVRAMVPCLFCTRKDVAAEAGRIIESMSRMPAVAAVFASLLSVEDGTGADFPIDESHAAKLFEVLKTTPVQTRRLSIGILGGKWAKQSLDRGTRDAMDLMDFVLPATSCDPSQLPSFLAMADAALSCRLFSVRKKAIEWVVGLVTSNPASTGDVQRCFRKFHFFAVQDPEPSVRAAALLAMARLPIEAVSVLEACLLFRDSALRCGDTNTKVRNAAVQFITALGPGVPREIPVFFVSRDLAVLKHCTGLQPHQPFRGGHFQLAMKIISGEVPLDRVTRIPLPASAETTGSTTAAIAMVWEAARFCVFNRLRTHFGGPVQTFEAIEKMLFSACDKSIRTQAGVHSVDSALLLEFVEALEKTTMNACDPGAHGMPVPAGVAGQFFRANKRVCVDWFKRFRTTAFKLAGTMEFAPLVISIAPRLIGESPPMRDQALLRLASTLSDLHDADSIRGLIAVHSAEWLQCFVAAAEGDLEKAAVLATEAPESLQRGISGHASSWRNTLGDWAGLDSAAPSPVHSVWSALVERKDVDEARAAVARMGDNPSLECALLKAITGDASLLESARSGLIEDLSARSVSPSIETCHVATRLLAAETVRHFVAGERAAVADAFSRAQLLEEIGDLGLMARVFHAMHSCCPESNQYPQKLYLLLGKLARKNGICSGLSSRVLSLAEPGMDRCSHELECLKHCVAFGGLPPSDAADRAVSLLRRPTAAASAPPPSLRSVTLLCDLQTSRNDLRASELKVLCQASKWAGEAGRGQEQVSMLTDAISANPNHHKSWLRLAWWCHDQSRADLSEARRQDTLRLSGLDNAIERTATREKGAGGTFGAEVRELLLSVIDRIEALDPTAFLLDDAVSEASQIFDSHFRSLPENVKISYMAAVTDALRSLFDLQAASASCFFRFLRSGCGAEKANGSSAAVLRLLWQGMRLGRLFEGVFSRGFAETPTSVWRPFVSQLFARLNCRSGVIRGMLAELLVRVSRDNPLAVHLPALLGSTVRLSSNPGRAAASQRVLADLETRSPATSTDVRRFVAELRRISVLWEEEWADGIKCAGIVFDNAVRAVRNQEAKHGGAKKREALVELYKASVRPAVAALEGLVERCSVPAETRHELEFQNEFIPKIKHALVSFRNGTPNNWDNAWRPFSEVQKSLLAHYKPGARILQSLSPSLADLRGALVPMPGIQSSTGAFIGILSVDKEVAVLPTKTRPKRVTFVGTDGSRFTYLLKGKDDLRLDERVAQFLSVANGLLSEDPSTTRRNIRSRNYSVIPLGKSTGLIQWVDGCVPISAVYNKWLQAATPDGTTPVTPIHRFIEKVVPALKEKKVTSSKRSEWPPEVLLSVFDGLAQETPGWLLRQTLWCSSVTALDHWEKTRTYTVSLAASSMLGYALGLGDRHLDNILLDTSTGELVNIDFNVCFDRGMQLRIPERVPFRLTQNLVGALGHTGVEGTYRCTCERVLTALSRSCATLASLLEDFAFDPLSDWSNIPNDERRREAETTLNMEMLLSRLADFKALAEDRNGGAQIALESLSETVSRFRASLLGIERIPHNERPDALTKLWESTVAFVHLAVEHMKVLDDTLRAIATLVSSVEGLEHFRHIRDTAEAAACDGTAFQSSLQSLVASFPLSREKAATLDSQAVESAAGSALQSLVEFRSRLLLLTKAVSRRLSAHRSDRTEAEEEAEGACDDTEGGTEDGTSAPAPVQLSETPGAEDDTVNSAACKRHAISILQRVRAKLSCAGAPAVRGKVDSLIKEATDPNNLSQLYEGWTSWI